AITLVNNSNTHFLNLVFGGGGLTATGATLVPTSSLELNGSASPPLRFVLSGSVVRGVPEPSSLVLGGIAAAAGLGLWAWRRRAAACNGDGPSHPARPEPPAQPA